MSKPKPTPEAPAEGAPELAPVMAHSLLGDLLQAIVVAVKFPYTPIPRPMVAQIDDALAAFRAGGGEASASVVGAGNMAAELPEEVAERLKKLEDFADKLSGDLPGKLSAMEAAIQSLQTSVEGSTTSETSEVAKQQADLLGETK